MPIGPGEQIGPYRIDEHVAVGGMGEVYRGHHTRLPRSVAVKVIGQGWESDPKTVKRFEREARLASTLDHANICKVYDYLQHEGQPLIVLEYCEGETLSQCLRRRRVRIEEVLEIASQLAAGLCHAHERGLIHRDMKPSNVMLTEGGAKILDFGLVKRAPARATASRGGTESLTGKNAIMGTRPYMAPEQLAGGPVDERTDLYGLGVIMFEMLAGRLPFVAKTDAALAAAILHQPAPTLQSLAPTVPAVLAHIVDRCLAKDPEERWQSAEILQRELSWVASRNVSEPKGPGRHVGWMVAGTAALVVGVFIVPSVIEDDQPGFESFVSATMVAPPGVRFLTNHQEAVVSPDGAMVLFSGADEAGRSQLWIRPLGEDRTTRVTAAEGAHTPFWDPTSTRIGYFERDELRVVDITGGPSEVVTSISLESRGATWGRNDVILFANDRNEGIYLVRPGEAPRPLTTPDRERQEVGHLWPAFLPDGEHFVYMVTSPLDAVQGIYLASVSSPRGRRVTGTTSSAAFANGHLLFARDGVLLAQRMEIPSGVLSGRPVPLASPVATTETLQTAFSASTNGVLTYSSAESKDITELVWRDTLGSGAVRIGEHRRHRNPALSPDGRLLAVEIYEASGGDIAWFDLETDRNGLADAAGLQPVNPVWSRDSRDLVFAASEPTKWGLYRWNPTSTSSATPIMSSPTELMLTDVSPDGRLVVYAERTTRGDYDVAVFDAEANIASTLIGEEDHEEFSGRISPSGAHIAYVSDRTGSFEVFVAPFPDVGHSCQISSGGGWDPAWGGSDEVLYFLTETSEMMAASVDGGTDCMNPPPRRLFETRVGDPSRTRNLYAFDSIRARFVLNARSDDPRARTIEVLLNWPSAVQSANQ